jgi:hypothetical protein
MALHPKTPDGRTVIIANLFLLGIKTNTTANVLVAAETPNIKGHLKPNDQNAFIKLAGTRTQRVLSKVLVNRALCTHQH